MRRTHRQRINGCCGRTGRRDSSRGSTFAWQPLRESPTGRRCCESTLWLSLLFVCGVQGPGPAAGSPRARVRTRGGRLGRGSVLTGAAKRPRPAKVRSFLARAHPRAFRAPCAPLAAGELEAGTSATLQKARRSPSNNVARARPGLICALPSIFSGSQKTRETAFCRHGRRRRRRRAERVRRRRGNRFFWLALCRTFHTLVDALRLHTMAAPELALASTAKLLSGSIRPTHWIKYLTPARIHHPKARPWRIPEQRLLHSSVSLGLQSRIQVRLSTTISCRAHLYSDTSTLHKSTGTRTRSALLLSSLESIARSSL